MPSTPPRGIWREAAAWLLPVAGVVAALVGGLYLSLFLLLFSPFPKDLAPSTAGFLMTSLVILAGSLLAPRHRLAVALALAAATLAALGLGVAMTFDRTGVAIGAVVAVAWVAWWTRPSRTGRETAWAAVVAVVCLTAFSGVVYARYVDRPPRADALAIELREALEGDTARVAAFYHYDLGGFIDREWLWRIDAAPDVVERAIAGLKLQPAEAVPDRFWRVPPHYWPRGKTATAAAFQSPGFSGAERGPDGMHYFLLHDRSQNRAFVWVKNNF